VYVGAADNKRGPDADYSIGGVMVLDCGHEFKEQFVFFVHPSQVKDGHPYATEIKSHGWGCWHVSRLVIEGNSK
jgi:hypothetical protein